MFKLLRDSLILRRLVKASERQTKAIEDIRDHICWGGAKRAIDPDDSGSDISYATDADTYRREIEHIERLNRGARTRGDE